MLHPLIEDMNVFNISVIVLITCVLVYVAYPKSRYYFKRFFYKVCLILAGTFGAFISVVKGRTPKNHWHTFRIFQFLTIWCGISFEIRNRKYIEHNEPFVIVANHQSSLDVLSLTHVWPENCIVLLKSSLKYMPGFNICAYLCEAIFVNRFSKENAHKSIEKSVAAIQNQRKIWIFPEGTRNSSGTLLPFKKGAFVIAREAQVPIVPIVFSSYQSFYKKDEHIFNYGGRVIIEVLPPMYPSSYPDVDSMVEDCRMQMGYVYYKISQELIGK
ncbi:unnamed protein product [Thelazia callipaeda]|uniref:1-acyl-sn-glycerol-3-phosphate acyltransferase n=1 Tax=Thelazia callipaeda TaxID=103827 RepID=A0A0N5D7R9_THECL|nr:unnamed protein product [Thelazia callipaeda]